MQSDQACTAVFAGDSPLDAASSFRSGRRRGCSDPRRLIYRLFHMNLDRRAGRDLSRGSLLARLFGLLALGDLLGTVHDDLAGDKVAVVAKIGEVSLLEVVLDAVR